MRILHISPSIAGAYGGPTQSLAGYARAALSEGMGVVVAAPRCGREDEAWLNAEIAGAEVRLFPGFGSGAFASSPALIGWLRSAGRQFDLVHVHGLWNPVSSLATRVCTRKGWPVVVRPFGTLSRYTFLHRRTWLKRIYLHILERSNLERADGIHFTTEVEQSEAAWYGVDFGNRSYVVPPPWRRTGCPASGGAPATEPPTVLFLSRLHPVKDVEGLLLAWVEVLKAVPSARLLIAGSGTPAYVARVKRQAEQLGVHRHVSFLGFVKGKEKARLWSSAHLFVLPSYHENFGVSVLEAVAAGLPVVITPQVQLASFVQQHHLGLVVERHPPALASAIVRGLQDEARQAHCRRYGPGLAEGCFSIERIGRQLGAMYLSVTRGC